MKDFTKSISSERDELIENMKKEKSERRKKRKKTFKHYFSKYFGFFLIAILLVILILLIIAKINYISNSTLINEKKYKIIEMHSNEDGDVLYYSYITKENQIKNDKDYLYNLDEKLYSSTNDDSYVVFEEWGCDGKVEHQILAKLYVSEKMYKDAFKKIEYNE